MFKRYPYRGWLLLAIIFWGLSFARYYHASRSVTPERMVATIENDLHNKEQSAEILLEDTSLIKRIFSDSLNTKDVEQLTSLSYGIYAYKGDTIIFWNNNKILADCPPNVPKGKSSLYQTDRGKFVRACHSFKFIDSTQSLVVLYPIATTYPFENNYLWSSFEAAEYIPVNSRLSSRNLKGSYPITTANEEVVGYIKFKANDLPVWQPDNVMLGLVILAILFSIFWFQLITIYYTRKRSFWTGFFILTTVLLVLRVLSYRFGLPFNLKSLEIFSPQLYATSVLLPSLGELLINALLFLWLAVFIIRNASYDFLQELKMSPVIKFILALCFSVVLIVYCFAYINIISSLVADSKISFDVSHFYTVSTYTIIGLFIITIITAASFIVVYLFSVQLKILVANKWLKYLLIIATGAGMILLSDTATDTYVSFILMAWLVLFIILLDVKSLALDGDLFAPQMIFWSAFIFAFCTAVLQYFNFIKERDARMRFAEQVVEQRDNITEYTLKGITENVKSDPILLDYLRRPSRTKRSALDERFDAIYLSGHLNKYESRLLIFDERGRSLYNNDTLSYRTLKLLQDNSIPTFTRGLYYRKNALDGRYYLVNIPIRVGDSTNGRLLGSVYIDMAVKQSTGKTVYPELLQPGSVIGSRNEEGYSWGVYVNNKLITQTSDYNFPVYLSQDIDGEYKFTEYQSSSELHFKVDDEKSVIVIRYHRQWLEAITLFSYLFGIQMLSTLITILYRIYLLYFIRINRKEKLINFTLKRRIHISFLGIVFVSFIIIGIITIMFFTLQYEQNSRKKQQLVMQLVERATLQYMRDNDITDDIATYNKEVSKPKFKYFITALSNSQKIDINLYHASGVLDVTSQESIYDRSLFARIIPPEAYFLLHKRGRQFLIQEEKIGRLSYVSCYKPIRNRNGVNLGYINVPFFSSEKELNYQISSIVVGLINLYAFVFLLSGILTVFITRWITRSFSVVIKSFSHFSLKKNEPVDWPYDDEIGLLVREYNKMVKKAEENARMLAQTEREGAWREMAQQVAHEIKNPLTPMKLNIQYLQQALNNNYDNVHELAKKVSESLIEQIENLSYIASEFSNFAKIPEARPETFDLNSLLEKTVDLYRNQSEIDVKYVGYKENLKVYTDKSQLLRVCNNLLENAVQAIPEDREGEVVVTVTKEGDEALVAFTDNGKGIEVDALDKIFQPYFTTKSSGTGLGLAMTKKIIEFWKGTIRFETTPGRGTTFYITIPLANGEEL